MLFSVAPGDPLCICDPQNLLKGHEPRFKELYLDNEPFAVIQEGVEISAQCQWTLLTSCLFRPLALAAWVNGKSSAVLIFGTA